MSSSSARGRLDSDRRDQYALFSRRDSSARPLPVWQECRVIAGGDFFFMNWQSADLSSACLTSIATSFPSRPRLGKALVCQSRCWLPLLSGGGVYPARAEPFVAAQSKSEAAADPFAKFVAEAAQGSVCRSFGSMPSGCRKAVEMCARVSPVGDGPHADHA